MEKFSTWRDPATGLAPFVYPLPPLSTAIQVPRLAWIPFIPLAVFRTCLVCLLAILFMIIDKTCALVFFFFSNELFAHLQSLYTVGFARMALYLFGLTRLPSDPPLSHRTLSQKLVTSQVHPGDMIVCNWSSFVEILYLAYLYNPTFVLPVPELQKPSGSTDPIARGFEVKTALELICSSGHPPNQNPPKPVKSLVQCVHESKRLRKPFVVFPEGTTSNNRALLKCFRLNKQSLGELDNGKIKVFCLAVKHEPPSSFKDSITVPIPSAPLNLKNFVKVNLTPILFPIILPPRSMTIRYPRKGCLELSSSDLTEHRLTFLFEEVFETLSSVAKLKLTSQINGLDKPKFLEYLKMRKS